MTKFENGRLLLVETTHNVPLSIPMETAQAKFEQGYQDKKGMEALALFVISWLSHTDLTTKFLQQQLRLDINKNTPDGSWLDQLDLEQLSLIMINFLTQNSQQLPPQAPVNLGGGGNLFKPHIFLEINKF